MEVAARQLHTTKKGEGNRRRGEKVVVKIWGSLDGLGFCPRGRKKSGNYASGPPPNIRLFGPK